MARLAFEEAIRAVEIQERTIDELRGRTSALLTLLGIGTVFLAGLALSDRAEPFNPWTWSGLIFPAVAAVLIGLVLIPSYGWTFTHRPTYLIKNYYLGEKTTPASPVGLEQTHVALTESIANWVKANHKKLKPLFVYYRFAVFATALTVIGWLGDLITIR